MDLLGRYPADARKRGSQSRPAAVFGEMAVERCAAPADEPGDFRGASLRTGIHDAPPGDHLW